MQITRTSNVAPLSIRIPWTKRTPTQQTIRLYYSPRKMTAKPIKNLKITDEDYTEEVEKGSIDVRFGKIAPDLKYTCILDMRYNVYGENEGKYPISEEITLSLKVPLKTSKKSGRILGSLINN